jgi:hypothetical protein
VTPVPASKKFWIFDGSVAQYPGVLSGDSVHMGMSCTDCHAGTDEGTARATAHVGAFDPYALATAASCQGCHSAEAALAAEGLHTTIGSYDFILAQRGFDQTDPISRERFEAQCTTCHTSNPALADAAGQTACGFCHVSVPATAGGGLLGGHAFMATPSMDNNCTACHGSRVKDEFYGQNNALLARNRAAMPASSPWADAGYSLQPDVHRTAGLTCEQCHAGAEMHGTGHPPPGTGDRYHVTTAPACEDCHAGLTGSSAYHSGTHFSAMDCQVCHAQPYKNCFGCHTDVTDTGVPFFRINQGDPTLADRRAASSDPASVPPDALMTFRVGDNPRFGEAGQRQFSVLRHVPVDRDTFTYTGVNAVVGLIPDSTSPLVPNMGDSATWKHATPHTIVRAAPIASACTNCHDGAFNLVRDPRFWLTDPVADALGWIPPEYEADEQAAND